jgi:hypothetical protein
MTQARGRLIGVTGHRTLSDLTRQLVFDAVKNELRSIPRPMVVTSLAAGADQLSASAALEVGARLSVIVPARNYISSFSADVDASNYQMLLSQAAEVKHMPYEEPSEEAYLAAGQEVVDLTDTLFAIWDGLPARGLGGTADVVRYARSVGRRVVVIWPRGSARS